MTDREIILSDIETLYLGNLGTVEFDLDLPHTGKLGSQISWESDAPHFLDAEGHVTRPAYGRGNRIVTLTATFAHGDASEQHAYNVQVLEQNSDFVVEHVAPIAVEGVADEATFLPDAVSATTEDGRTLALRVKWDESIERTWAEVGSYTAEGTIHGTDCRVTAEVTIAAEAAPRTAAEADVLVRAEGMPCQRGRTLMARRTFSRAVRVRESPSFGTRDGAAAASAHEKPPGPRA